MDVLFDIATLVLAGLAIGDILAPQWFHPGRAPGAPEPPSGDVPVSQRLFLEFAVMGSLLLCLIVGAGLSDTPLGRGLAGFVAAFWVLRLVFQLRQPRATGGPGARLARWGLAGAFAFVALVFTLAALTPGRAAAPRPGVAPLPSQPEAPEMPAIHTPTPAPREDLGPLAPHGADGHTHDGLFATGHDHEHGDEVAPDQVPIVRYEPESGVGPHGGVLARLSTPEEPDAGFLELKFRRATGRLEVWLARDRMFQQPLGLAPDASVRMNFLLAKARLMALRTPAGTSPIGPYTAGAEGEENARWLKSLPPGTLAHVLIRTGDAVYASDDLELVPPGR